MCPAESLLLLCCHCCCCFCLALFFFCWLITAIGAGVLLRVARVLLLIPPPSSGCGILDLGEHLLPQLCSGQSRCCCAAIRLLLLSPSAKQVFKWLGQAVEKPAAIIIFLLGLVSFARLRASCHVACLRVRSGVCCFYSDLVVVIVAASILIVVARCGRSVSKAFFIHRKIAALCKVRSSLSFIYDEWP